MQPDERLLDRCKALIETKVGWGSGGQWSSQDFTQLSEHIREATGVQLSATTLKRIWGKVKYESIPNTTTLNTLAHFLGYENWRAFALQHTNEPVTHGYTEQTTISAPLVISTSVHGDERRPLNEIVPRKSNRKTVHWLAWVVLIAVAGGLLLSGVLAWRTPPRQVASLNPADFSFSSQPIAKGLPNSVIFTYNASAAPSDCVYIQQTWDPQRRFKVDKDQTQATSLYYYPGVFQAKLVVNDQVVREHELFIPTNGWLPLVEQEPVPVYFKAEEARQNGKLMLSVAQLEASNIPLQPTAPWVRYCNVREFNGLSSDNFTLETELKNDYGKGSAACQHSQVTILCANNAITIPLTVPGCISSLNLGAADPQMKVDLAKLGCDFSNWVKLRCEVKNKQVTISVNNRVAIQGITQGGAGKIIGISYRFQGVGSVNYVKLWNGQQKLVYADEF